MAHCRIAAALCGALAAMLGACSGPALRASTGAAGATGAPATSDGGAGSGGPDAGAEPIPGLDPGRAVIHRLNNLEYDNTIHDLLGVQARARATFQPDEEGEFDND